MRKTVRGFTLIELIIAVSLFLSLLTLFWINFSTLPSKATLNSTYQSLMSDIKLQQSSAMNGQSAYGVYFAEKSYTLFKGSSYNANDSENFDVNFENDNLSIANNLFLNQVVIFQSGSGEILNFDSLNNSLDLTDNLSGDNHQIKLNKYGTEE